MGLSVTGTFKKIGIRKAEELFSETNYPKVPKLLKKKTEVINPYPNWVNTKRNWGLFGTFTDYMMRLQIKLLYDEVYQEHQLIAQKGLTIGNAFPSLFSVSEEALDWISAYKSSTDWESSLFQTYQMSYLDSLYRSRRYSAPNFDNSQVEECVGFFTRVDDWLKELNFHEPIHLNPTLGSSDTLPADADLFTRDILWDIKTVKKNTRDIKSHWFQLLSYVALDAWRRKNGSKFEGAHDGFKEVGILFPQQLIAPKCDISSWSDESRLEFASILIELSRRYANT